ncbi:MAG: insulinase family protein [Candidatus Eisenbacteria bacterium]|uniref:Insulinase family protein n=1 Tax=Eiseniibacteriota bacterium TaxID=2212470 RepID=A0A7Y2H268_UNCEI|nr:insulinase family protein [Candidatus Eisenbacteria bacterium]
MTTPASAQNLKKFEKKVTEFTLDNGLHFIIVERHEAPVVSFMTYANVGGVDEVKGVTGMAHMFEHMAFKGTSDIGTKDPAAERECMDRADALYDEWRREKAKGSRANPDEIARLEEEFKAVDESCREFIVPAEYDQLLTSNGATGLNASTWYDETRYYLNLPSNKLELWFALESVRFLDPVLREFYQEKDVVTEERRMRTENQPIGKLLEETVSAAYKSHPYGEPVVGHMSDIHSYTREEARKWFETYYGPGNLTICIAGDVDPDEAKKLAKTYFERLPVRPEPPLVDTVEPPQLGERRVTIEDPAQPAVLIAYHKPDMFHEDAAVFDAISDIMGSGRTSRLNKVLVKEKKIAVAAGGFAGFIGGKFPDLFLFFAIPSQGHTAAECEEAILAEIEKMKNELVEADELRKSKTRARAGLIRQLGSNSGLAFQLAGYQAKYGDWRRLFTEIDDIEAVTADDIKRVANEYFKKNNRTVGSLVTEEKDVQTES